MLRLIHTADWQLGKAFAFDQRNARKDAHDLVYVLKHYPGGLDTLRRAFVEALASKHEEAVRDALGRLATRFRDPDPDRSYRGDGAVAVARFEDGDIDVGADEELHDIRILRQRTVADFMARLLERLI